jgi:hypothetical protein
MPDDVVVAADIAEKPKPLTVQIRQDYKQGLETSNVTVREMIVKDLVDKEVRKRAEAFQKVFDLAEAAQHELKKIKPTPVGYELDGKPKELVYTQDQAKQHRELTEKLGKYENAMQKALGENDFQKVFELTGSK